jgi:hypothetical protein
MSAVRREFGGDLTHTLADAVLLHDATPDGDASRGENIPLVSPVMNRRSTQRWNMYPKARLASVHPIIMTAQCTSRCGHRHIVALAMNTRTMPWVR